MYRSQFNSSKDPLFESKTQVARELAKAVTESRHCLSSQHLKGANNVVADYLSFAGANRHVKHHPLAYDDPDDTLLTQRFHSCLSQIIPSTFEILPLPDDVFSFALRVLQTAESSLVRAQSSLTKRKIVSGADGLPSAERFSSQITRSSIQYPRKTANSLCDPSWNYTGTPSGTLRDDLLASVRNRWSDRLSTTPQALWVRRFGQISAQAPCTSPSAPSFSHPLNPSSKPAPTPTRQPDDTKRPPQNSSKPSSVSMALGPDTTLTPCIPTQPT